MNIIEAIKGGKYFRRKSWKNDQCYFSKGTMDDVFSIDDALADDWEIKEPEQVQFTVLHTGTIFPFENLSRQIKREENMKFDPTKPVQTKNGCKAKILYTNLNNMQPIVAIIEDKEGNESLECFHSDGIFYKDSGESSHDLVNIPEQKNKKIQVHLKFIESETSTRNCGVEFEVNDELNIDDIDIQQILISITENLKLKEK